MKPLPFRDGNREMRLSRLIQECGVERVDGFREADICRVAYTPEEALGEGILFACIDEYHRSNCWGTTRSYLEALPGLGLAALLTPEPVSGLGIPQIITHEPRRLMGEMARLLNGSPDTSLDVFAVTGTNGKTTTARLLGHLLRTSGARCATLGTLGLDTGEGVAVQGSYTTPLSPELYALMSQIREMGLDSLAMEVSSHALALDRVAGLSFNGAILTNIERDHLDFHGTLEAYAEAKQRLFRLVKSDGVCVLNRSAPEPFLEVCRGKVVTYGWAGSGADLEASAFTGRREGSQFRLAWGGDQAVVETRLAGAFQVENTLAALALLLSRGIPLSGLLEGLKTFATPCGRMEQLRLPGGGTAIVDYAHNPDGLGHVLKACRDLCKGQLHVVFGCGGDRDRGKRPLMGELAAHYADVCWLTSDNPRTEAPEQILDDIFEGMRGARRVERSIDRATAIREAVGAAGAEDLVLVAGKGHEDYQIIGLEKHPFSDQAVLRELGAVDAT